MTPAHPRRPWPRALGLAALTVWLPALLPFWVGPLTECEHCVKTYATFLPLVPGVIVPFLLHLDDAAFVLVGAAVVLALFGGVGALLRFVGTPWSAMGQTAVILAVGLEAYGFSCALRM